jgi:hypothetical protein
VQADQIGQNAGRGELGRRVGTKVRRACRLVSKDRIIEYPPNRGSRSALWSGTPQRTVAASILVARLVGKVAGIIGAAALVVGLGRGRLPDGVRWTQLAGAAALCGIGFTVPLLFASLTLGTHQEFLPTVRASLLVASVLSLLIGGALLWVSLDTPSTVEGLPGPTRSQGPTAEGALG